MPIVPIIIIIIMIIIIIPCLLLYVLFFILCYFMNFMRCSMMFCVLYCLRFSMILCVVSDCLNCLRLSMISSIVYGGPPPMTVLAQVRGNCQADDWDPADARGLRLRWPLPSSHSSTQPYLTIFLAAIHGMSWTW